MKTVGQKYDSIIITFPVQFLLDLSGGEPQNIYTQVGNTKTYTYVPATKNDHILFGFKQCIQQIETVRQDADNSVWYHSIGTKPTQQVLYCYITILGKIRYRATIAGWEGPHNKQFADGRKVWGKNWLILSDFVPAPHDIERKGFQGFRYTDKLF